MKHFGTNFDCLKVNHLLRIIQLNFSTNTYRQHQILFIVKYYHFYFMIISFFCSIKFLSRKVYWIYNSTDPTVRKHIKFFRIPNSRNWATINNLLLIISLLTMPSTLIKHNRIKLFNQSIIARHNQSRALAIKKRCYYLLSPHKPIALSNPIPRIKLKHTNLRLIISLGMFRGNNQQQIIIYLMILHFQRNRYGINQTALDHIKL